MKKLQIIYDDVSGSHSSSSLRLKADEIQLVEFGSLCCLF